jgi:hypothetical protein
MVKRDDEGSEANLGSVRDTSGISDEPSQDDRGDASTNLREFYYRPEMGTIVTNDDVAHRDDS